jgi:hypothetical protein
MSHEIFHITINGQGINLSLIKSDPDIADAIAKKHIQGTDQTLDEGGVNEVSVSQVKGAVINSHAPHSDDQDISGKVDKEIGKSLVLDTEIAKIHSLHADDQDLTNYDYSLTTGIIKRGILSINTLDNTKLDISAGSSLYVNNSNPESPVIEILTWPTQTLTPPSIDINGRLFIGIHRDSPGVASIIFSQEFTPKERRTVAILGRCWTTNGTTILSGVGQYAQPVWGTEKTLEDLMDTLGSLNRSGNEFAPHEDTLLLDKSAGTSFRFRGGSGTDLDSPNILNDSSINGISLYRYFLAQASIAIEMQLTAIDPEYYDLAGIKTAVTSGKFTVQRLYYFPGSGVIQIFYGQHLYDTLADAENNLRTETFNISNSASLTSNGSILRAFIIVQQGCTDLADITKAKILNSLNTIAGGSSGVIVPSAVDSVNGKTGTVILNPDDLIDTISVHKFTNASDITRLQNTSGLNTGDQTLSGLGGVPITRTVNGHALSSDVIVTKSDINLGNVDNKSEATIIADVKADTIIADTISKKHAQHSDDQTDATVANTSHVPGVTVQSALDFIYDNLDFPKTVTMTRTAFINHGGNIVVKLNRFIYWNVNFVKVFKYVGAVKTTIDFADLYPHNAYDESRLRFKNDEIDTTASDMITEIGFASHAGISVGATIEIEYTETQKNLTQPLTLIYKGWNFTTNRPYTPNPTSSFPAVSLNTYNAILPRIFTIDGYKWENISFNPYMFYDFNLPTYVESICRNLSTSALSSVHYLIPNLIYSPELQFNLALGNMRIEAYDLPRKAHRQSSSYFKYLGYYTNNKMRITKLSYYSVGLRRKYYAIGFKIRNTLTNTVSDWLPLKIIVNRNFKFTGTSYAFFVRFKVQ